MDKSINLSNLYTQNPFPSVPHLSQPQPGVFDFPSANSPTFTTIIPATTFPIPNTSNPPTPLVTTAKSRYRAMCFSYLTYTHYCLDNISLLLLVYISLCVYRHTHHQLTFMWFEWKRVITFHLPPPPTHAIGFGGVFGDIHTLNPLSDKIFPFLSLARAVVDVLSVCVYTRTPISDIVVVYLTTTLDDEGC